MLATFTTNDKNLYSGGLALTNMFPGIARWIHTLILGVLGTALACLRITKYFTNWLLALGVVFSPLVGILLTDYFIVHRRKIRISDLELDSPLPLFWRTKSHGCRRHRRRNLRRRVDATALSSAFGVAGRHRRGVRRRNVVPPRDSRVVEGA